MTDEFFFPQIITVRSTAFEPAAAGGSGGVEEAPAPGNLPANSEFVGQVR